MKRAKMRKILGISVVYLLVTLLAAASIVYAGTSAVRNTPKVSAVIVVYAAGSESAAPGKPVSDEANIADAVTQADDSWVNPFSDVLKTDWFYASVKSMSQRQIMNGVSESLFLPLEPMTRAMFVTTLYRMAGQPSADAAEPFEDVAAGQWYTAAVAWASTIGIADGYGSRFGTEDCITREQTAVLIYRYMKWSGRDVSAASDLTEFGDAKAVSDWAVDGVSWASAAGLIRVRTPAELAPQEIATRAEVAAMLERIGS